MDDDTENAANCRSVATIRIGIGGNDVPLLSLKPRVVSEARLLQAHRTSTPE